jgi:integrase
VRQAGKRARAEGRRLINGDRGGYLGYATWRKFLALAHGFTAAPKDGLVEHTARELGHVCASLMIASGATGLQVAHPMGHSTAGTASNISGHRAAQDRAAALDARNAAISRRHACPAPWAGGRGPGRTKGRRPDRGQPAHAQTRGESGPARGLL